MQARIPPGRPDKRGRMDETYDVVVVGGGAAGLSAVALSRSRRSVLVIYAVGRAEESPPRHPASRSAHDHGSFWAVFGYFGP